MPVVGRSQMRASDPFELEVQTVGSHHMNVGNETHILWKGNHITLSPAHKLCFSLFLVVWLDFVTDGIKLLIMFPTQR